MKCNFCEEQLEKISFPCQCAEGYISGAYLDMKTRACLYACTSGDCKNVGNVIIIPIEPVEELEKE